MKQAGAALLCLLLLGLCACGEGAQEKQSSAQAITTTQLLATAEEPTTDPSYKLDERLPARESVLLEKVRAKTTYKPLLWCFSDYDHDGKGEAFVVMGETDPEILKKMDDYLSVPAELWFVSDMQIQKLASDFAFMSAQTAYFKSKNLFLLNFINPQGATAGSSITEFYSVVNSKPKKVITFDRWIEQLGGRDFYMGAAALDGATDKSFGNNGIDEDGFEMLMGRGWKPYFAQVNEYTMTVKECTATELKEIQLKQYGNITELSELLKKEKGDIRTIYQWNNGIISLTFDVETVSTIYHKYINMRVIDGKLIPLIANKPNLSTTFDDPEIIGEGIYTKTFAGR